MGMKLCTSISPNCNSPYVVTAPDERPRAVCYSLMWLGAHDHNAVAPCAGIYLYIILAPWHYVAWSTMALKPPHAKRSMQRIAFQVVDPFAASQLSALNFFSISLVVVLVGFLQVGTRGISICLPCFIWRPLPNMWRGLWKAPQDQEGWWDFLPQNFNQTALLTMFLSPDFFESPCNEHAKIYMSTIKEE